jgi:hypothetical protein
MEAAEPTARRRIGISSRNAMEWNHAPSGPRMTAAAKAAILPRHACPGTVWRTVPKRNLVVGLGTVLAAMVRRGRRRHQPSQSRSAIGIRPWPSPPGHSGDHDDRADYPGPGQPSELTPNMQRRQIYADPRRHRQNRPHDATLSSGMEVPMPFDPSSTVGCSWRGLSD